MNSGLLLGVLTLLGVLVGGGVQFVLSLLAHRQAARDDRRARTRGYFAKVYEAAYMFLIYSQTAAIQPPAMSGTPSQVLRPVRKCAYARRHGQTRTQRHAMAPMSAALTSRETPRRPSRAPPPTHHRWHPVDSGHGCALARPASTVRL